MIPILIITILAAEAFWIWVGIKRGKRKREAK